MENHCRIAASKPYAPVSRVHCKNCFGDLRWTFHPSAYWKPERGRYSSLGAGEVCGCPGGKLFSKRARHPEGLSFGDALCWTTGSTASRHIQTELWSHSPHCRTGSRWWGKLLWSF